MVGATFCVGVIGMYHSGIGGGGFAMLRDKQGNYEAIDFRETAPAAASEGMYDGNKDGSIFGGLAVGVPSEVRGLEYIHSKYGVRATKFVCPESVKPNGIGTTLERGHAGCDSRCSEWIQR